MGEKGGWRVDWRRSRRNGSSGDEQRRATGGWEWGVPIKNRETGRETRIEDIILDIFEAISEAVIAA